MGLASTLLPETHVTQGDGQSSDPQIDLEQVLQLIRRAMAAQAEGNKELAETVWTEGVDGEGQTIVCVQDGDSLYKLRVPDMQAFFAMIGPPLRRPRADQALKLPYQPSTLKALAIREQLVAPGTVSSVILAGDAAQQTAGIETLKGTCLSVAGYTCRGPTQEAQGVEYKPINEDGVVVRLRAADAEAGLIEIASVGAFDQAGGEGAVEGRHGAASDLAARCFDEAARKIELGAEPHMALKEAVKAASDQIRALGVGAVSTFAGAVVTVQLEATGPVRTAHVISVGDSRVLLVDAKGVVKEKTLLHNLGARVSAGDIPEIPPALALRFAGALSRGVGTDDDSPELSTWLLEAGDRVVVETDGLGDARELEESPIGVWHADRTAQDQGLILAHTKNVSEVIQSLTGYALDQMATRYGKPDNIGVAALQVLC